MKGRIGIYFTTRHCQTRKIANCLGQWFREYQADVTIVDLSQSIDHTPDLRGFDAVLIGSPVYMQRYPREIVRFARDNRQMLARVPSTGFFSVCLTATHRTPVASAASLARVKKFLDQVAWNPHWIASFPGALNYLEYNPVLRWIMRNTSRREGGPTDTRDDYYLTRWDEVRQFAFDFYNDEPSSPYRADELTFATRTLNALMPDFEQRIVQQLSVNATPSQIRSAIETMELEDMPLANLLARLRNLSRKSTRYSSQVLFQDAAAAFGSLLIAGTQPQEILAGLIGQFWKRDYGIRRMRSVAEFRSFAEPDYSEALTNFWFGYSDQARAVVRTETRVHSLSPQARRKFRLYWWLVSLGIRLYMRSVLHGIRRSLHRQQIESLSRA